MQWCLAQPIPRFHNRFEEVIGQVLGLEGWRQALSSLFLYARYCGVVRPCPAIIISPFLFESCHRTLTTDGP